MIGKIILTDKENTFSNYNTVFIESTDDSFVKELRRYECFVRALLFLDEHRGSLYTELDKPPDGFDFVLDLSEDFKKKTNDRETPADIILDFEKYVLSTPHLDKYGVSR